MTETETHTLGLLVTHSVLHGLSGSADTLRAKLYPVKVLPNGELRNLLDSSWPREPLADLAVTAQADSTGDGDFYGWRTQYSDVFAADLPRVEEMVKVLRKVERAHTKLNAELGYPESFGSYAARTAQILGIQSFGWKLAGNEGLYSGNTYRWGDATRLQDRLARLLRDFREHKLAPT